MVCYLGKNRPFWLLLVAASIRNIPGYALGAWLPTFYKREFGVSSQHYGIPVGLAVIFGGGLGSFLGGFLSDRYISVSVQCVCTWVCGCVRVCVHVGVWVCACACVCGCVGV